MPAANSTARPFGEMRECGDRDTVLLRNVIGSINAHSDAPVNWVWRKNLLY